MNESRLEIYQNYLNDKYGADPTITRMWLAYDRYHEAEILRGYLTGLSVKNLKGLDYGCGVGDYGIYLLKGIDGSIMHFYDFEPMIDFVEYRLQDKEAFDKDIMLRTDTIMAPGKKDTIGDYDMILQNKYDLVIFGEVLEHLENPLEVLNACLVSRVRFILTSSYPYRDDPAYFLKSGHSTAAGMQQPTCRALLEKHYNVYAPEGGLKIWKLKK